MKKIIFLLLTFSLVVATTMGCNKKTETEFEKLPVVKASTSSSETTYKAPEQAQQELYQDVFVTLLDPYIRKAIDDYYDQFLTTFPMYSPGDVEILNVERPMGYRSFLYTIKLQIQPYVGPHESVGIDQLTVSVSAGKVKIEKFEHIKSYELPPRLQDLIKKGN